MEIRTTTAWIKTGLGRGRELRFPGFFVIGCFVIGIVGCATTQHAGERGLPETRGTASYYADKYAGRTTANGEIFNQEALTAAHRSLPFGTRVRATRVDHTERPSVVVRINDRGPFEDARVIDLSKEAARRLQMIRDGVAEVKLEVVSYPAGTEPAPSDSSESESSGAGASDVAW